MKGATGSWTDEYSKIDVFLLSLIFDFLAIGSLSSLFLSFLPGLAAMTGSSNWYLN
jgi:hypothetical protein